MINSTNFQSGKRRMEVQWQIPATDTTPESNHLITVLFNTLNSTEKAAYNAFEGLLVGAPWALIDTDDYRMGITCQTIDEIPDADFEEFTPTTEQKRIIKDFYDKVLTPRG